MMRVAGKPHIKVRMDASTYVYGPDSAHEAASYTRPDMRSWGSARYSADGEYLPEQDTIVGRSRDLQRNNGVAEGGITTIVDNVVGTGFRLGARPQWRILGWTEQRAKEFRAHVEARFHNWWWSTKCHAGDTLTGDQLTQLTARTVLSSGEAVTLPLWIDRGDGAMTKLQIVDPDQLAQPDFEVETPRFKAGIEFDEYAQPVAYHFRKAHPNDDLLLPRTLRRYSGDDFERVPRKTEFGRLRVLHVFDPERPGQSRGKPLLTAVLPQFKTLDRYTQAELQAALANALVAMTIETPLDQQAILQLFNKDHEKYLAYREKNAVRLTPGGILPLFPGDKVTPFIPGRPVTAFSQFVEVIYRTIGVRMGLPLELLFKDFSKTNYSSARAALLEAWRTFQRQRDWLCTMWMDPIYALWMEEQVHAGAVDASLDDLYDNGDALLMCRWRGPGRGWIDPVKEANAARIRIRGGFSTLERECSEQGEDWIEVLDQQAIEKAARKERGLEEPDLSEGPGRPEEGTQRPDDDDEEAVAA